MTLTKARLADVICDGHRMSKRDSERIVDTLLTLIKAELASGEHVLISGFGKFSVKHKAARRGRNPATGDDLILRPRKVVTFKPSGKLRDRINGT